VKAKLCGKLVVLCKADMEQWDSKHTSMISTTEGDVDRGREHRN